MPYSKSKAGNEDLPLNIKDSMKIFELSPDVLFIHVDGIIKFINNAGLLMFGASSPDVLIGKSIWNIYPAETHGLVRTRIQQLLDTQQMAPFIELNIKKSEW